MRNVSLERGSQRHRMAAPRCFLAEGAMTAREGKQRKGLIVEIELGVAYLAVETDDGCNGAVGAEEASGEEIERVSSRLAPGPRAGRPPPCADRAVVTRLPTLREGAAATGGPIQGRRRISARLRPRTGISGLATACPGPA
jgi:hypothetical protein